MRILFLNHNVGWSGGTFFRAWHFARHLARRGHNTTLVTISASRRMGWARETRDGVEILYSPDLLWGIGRTGWDPWDTWRRCSAVGGRAWDVIHAWDSRPAVILPALWARRRSPRTEPRLVLDWCDWWGRGGTQAERRRPVMRAIAPVETWFEEHFRAAADGTTVISRPLFERALALGVRGDTIRLLRQGCDATEGQCADRAAARRRLALDAAVPVIVTVGALHAADASLLFDGLRLLFAQRPDCRFFLIGKHGASVPSDIAAAPQFRATGYLPAEQLRDYTAACDALWVPLADTLASRARWPSKVNPLLAAGRTVVITRVGDLPELLERRGAGVVTPPAADDLVAATLRVLADDTARSHVEDRAREVARDELSWLRLAKELEDFYQELRARSAATAAAGRPGS